MADRSRTRNPRGDERSASGERRERRAPAGPLGSIRWVRSILGRPLALERRPDGLHVTLLDRRRPPEVIQAESMARLLEELRVRLLQLEDRSAGAVMRHLVAVHDVLGRKGWVGLELLDSGVLRKAVIQLQMLVEHEPSARLTRLAEKLRMLQAGAEAREERVQAHARQAAAGAPIEVSEVSADEFDSSRREWESTAAAPLEPLEPPEPAPGSARGSAAEVAPGTGAGSGTAP